MSKILIEILNKTIEGFAVDESKIEEQKIPDTALDRIQNAIDKAKQKQLSPNQRVRVHECNHDENKPCKIHYEAGGMNN